MDKKWYVVNTKTGFELKAKEAIDEKLKNEVIHDLVEEVIVPTEKVLEIVNGKKISRVKKIFPGYILIKMIVTDKTWHFIKSVPYITGFVGRKTTPVPISDQEAETLISSYKEGKLLASLKSKYEVGDNVRVIDGPFVNFTGSIEDVKPEKSKIRVLVSIFGRATPVEVDFDQVEKI